MSEPQHEPSISPVVVQLLKGALERDQYPKLWQALDRLRAQIVDYVAVMGLDLIVDEAEGFAFLRQKRYEEGEEAVPRLIVSRPLAYHVSLLCVLLRRKLVEADAGGGETRVILSREQIVELMRVYLPYQANDAKIVDQVDRHISKVVELGFLRELKGQEETFEVRRILKALVDADWLADLEEKLRTYQAHAANES